MPPPVYAVWKKRQSNKDIGNTIIELGKLVFVGGIITTALLLIVGITINRKEE
jgi:hypothetical protein